MQLISCEERQILRRMHIYIYIYIFMNIVEIATKFEAVKLGLHIADL